MRRLFPLLGAFLPLLFLTGCETAPPGIQAAKVAMAQKYATETPGDYFIGRRYYKLDFGSDNNYEYKLYGYFSGDKVYEPASNTIYPEFVLKNYELISTNPPPIFSSQLSGRAQAEVSRYLIEKPQF